MSPETDIRLPGGMPTVETRSIETPDNYEDVQAVVDTDKGLYATPLDTIDGYAAYNTITRLDRPELTTDASEMLNHLDGEPEASIVEPSHQPPLSARHFAAAVEWAIEDDNWVDYDHELWYPVHERGPYIVETTATPIAYLAHHIGTEQFVQDFGARACNECPNLFGVDGDDYASTDEIPQDELERRVVCPECGNPPEIVREAIEVLRDDHPGVAIVIYADEQWD